MNNPQKEDGFTGIANEIVEALCRTNMSPHESRILWCVLRKTYGYNKKADWMALSQLVTLTGMHKSNVSRAKKKLIERHIIIQTGNRLSFNKFYTQWRELSKRATLPKQVIAVTQTGNRGLPKQVHTKDNITKDNITKERIIELSKINIRPETNDLYKWIEARCSSLCIENHVKKESLDVYVSRYIGKVRLREQLDLYMAWMIDKNKRVLRSSSVGNCFKRAKEYDKKKELERMEKGKSGFDLRQSISDFEKA